MQIKDVFSLLYKIVFDTALYTVIIAALLGALPSTFFENFDFKPTPFDNEHLHKGIGSSKWNNDLVSKAQIIANDDVVGAESFASIGKHLYTGLADGRLVRFDKKTLKMELVTRFGKNSCIDGVTSNILECGRPLGLREHPDGSLYVLDANTGLYRVNVTTFEKTYLKLNYKAGSPIVYNDLVFDPQDSDMVYITVSTSRWNLDRLAYSLFEHDDSGYLMAANLKTGKHSILTTGHYTPNGVDITADSKYLLLALTGEYQIKKIAMEDVRQAVKSGKEVPQDKVTRFGSLLAGEPDNIRIDRSTGDVLVGMFSSRPDNKQFRDYLSYWPKIRKSVGRTCYVLSMGLDYVNQLYANHAIKQLAFDLYSGHVLYKSLPRRDGAVFKLCGKTGQLKSVLGSNEFNSVSEAIIDEDGDLYYGSFRNKFIGRIPKGKH